MYEKRDEGHPVDYWVEGGIIANFFFKVPFKLNFVFTSL